jgi:endonuclease/exonuclease/phosphatase family metal-dependent hydrolase
VLGSAVYSRYPLRDPAVRIHRASGFHQARATVTLPGAAPVEFESVHPCAPASAGLIDTWHADLAAQPAATPDGMVRILAGDFNATLDHALLRGLIDTGYRDAADVVGAGLRTTWPNRDHGPAYVPGVTLDRVLADRRVGVTRVSIHSVPGSDHRAFFTELILPAG